MAGQEARRDSSILEKAAVERFARRLQQRRRSAGLSLDQLAERSGVSRATLSNIERASVNPSLGVAVKIAAALGLSVAHLLDEDRPHPATVVPAGARATFTDPETGYQRQLYPAFEGGTLELIRHLAPPGVSSETLPAHPPGTEKFLVVEAGRLRLHVGDTTLDANPGDAVRYAADLPHRFENTGPDTCVWLLIVPAERPATPRR
jgi:transcriptional regulator with XRE-family HTH domain